MTRRYTGGFLTAKEQATDSNTANGIFTLSDAQALTAQGNFPTGRWTPQRSLRFKKSSQTWLQRTPTASGSQTTYTISQWVKLGQLLSNPNSDSFLWCGGNASVDAQTSLLWKTYDSTDYSLVYQLNNGSLMVTNAKLRDPSAWYHIVSVCNTTASIASERMKLYINGVLQTSFSSLTYPTQNSTTAMGTSSYDFTLGAIQLSGGRDRFFDGYMSEVHYIDGQALDASYFGTTDPETGTWVPKRYTGTYGVNGFYLPFKDSSGSTYNVGTNHSNDVVNNLLMYSEQFDNSMWNSAMYGNWSPIATATANTTTDPLGGSTADTISTTTDGGVARMQRVSVKENTTYTFSIYLKRNSSTALNIIVAYGTPSFAGYDVTNIESQISASWNRVSYTFKTPANCTSVEVGIGKEGFVGSQSVYAWGAQLNEGSAAATYIQTVTRNNMLPNNFALSPASATDSMVDVPGIAAVSTQNDTGGVTRGNYCTLNAAIRPYASVDSTGSSQPSEQITDGNLRVYYRHDGVSGSVYGTHAIPNTGKWYFEYTDVYESANAPVRYGQWVGIAPVDRVEYQNGTYGGGAFDVGYVYTSEGGLNQSNSVTGIANQGVDSYTNYGTGDIIGVAYDADARTISWYKNNILITTVRNIYYQSAGYTPCAGGIKQNTGAGWNTSNIPAQGLFNFGQRPFAYTPPVGHKSICTTNFPNPVIKRSSDHFDIKTWKGNGTSLTVGTTTKQSTAHRIGKSTRFSSANGTHLSRFPATAGNRKVSTFSCWFKRGTIGSRQAIFGCANSSDTATLFVGIDANNKIEVDGHTLLWRLTTASFTDTTKWYHLVLSIDTNQVNPDSRIKLYVDGVRITSFTTYNNPSQGADMGLNQASVAHNIGQMGSTIYYDGYIAESIFVDGQQLEPSSFGQFDASNNWVPQRYTGSYGTNGFYLPMTSTPEIGNTAYSTYFDGSAGKFNTPTSANLAMGSSDFTIELWVNQASLPQPYPRLFQFGAGWNTNQNWALDPGHADFGADRFVVHSYAYGGNATPLLVGKTKIKYGVWYHVALTRSGSTWNLFVNGKLDASNTWAGSVDNGTSNYMIFGGSDSGYEGTAWYNGYLSNIRVVKGSALYTANFTPPTTDLTAVSGTQLLINGSSLADSSSNAFSLTSSTPAPRISYPYALTYPSTYFSGSSAYITGTLPSGIGTGDFTVEMWARPTAIESYDTIFSTTRGTTGFNLGWGSDGLLTFFTNGSRQVTSGSVSVGLNVWSHIAYVRSGTTITIYVNGKSVASGNSQSWNLTATAFSIGSLDGAGGEYFNGYLRDVRVTKQALYSGNFTPATSPLTKTSQGATAANVILLACQNSEFVENSDYNLSLTRFNTTTSIDYYPAYSNTVGLDSSGNANHYGISGVSLGVDTSYSILTDSPTDGEVSGVINGNYAILNAADKGSVVTVSAGGLKWAQSTTTAQAIRATLPMPTGKWYWELNAASNNSPGILKQSGVISTYVGGDSKGWSYFVDGTIYNNGSNVSFGASHTAADIISVAFDADTGKLWFAKNGVWQASGNPATGANPAVIVPLDPNDLYYPAMSTSVTGAVVGNVNFGQRPFEYAVPSGFKSLNTKNLRDIGSYNLPDSFGNFVNTPDLVWVKSRDNSYQHSLFDTVRGPAKTLCTNSAASQSNEGSTSLQSFVPNGFMLSSDNAVQGSVNNTGATYVGWAWNRGKTPGFDIVAYAGDSNNSRMIEHGLSQVPAFYITKNLNGYNNTNGYSDWSVYHKSLPVYNYGSQALYLHTTLAAGAAGGFYTTPTSTQFGPNQTLYDNVSGQNYVAYLWAEVPGFSKFGSYVGNGSNDGSFVYTGFRPRYIMIKSSTSSQDWKIIDTARNTQNPSISLLAGNVTATEDTNSVYNFDILSNGFKVRNTYGYANTSGATYIYAAFAETPFKYANAR